MLVEGKGLFIITDVGDKHGVVNPFEFHMFVAWLYVGSDEWEFLVLGPGLDESYNRGVCCHDCFETMFRCAQV